jgi:hypothetical protein
VLLSGTEPHNKIGVPIETRTRIDEKGLSNMSNFFIFLAGGIASLLGVYCYVILPMQRERSEVARQLQEAKFELDEERLFRVELFQWVEIECKDQPEIEKALKQRAKERLGMMQRLQDYRRQLLP